MRGLRFGFAGARDAGTRVLRFTGALPASVSYSRAGTSAALSAAGVISFVGSNVAPVTDRGLLIEPARSNLVTASNYFGGGSSVTVLTGQAAPDGSAAASLLIEDTSTSSHGTDKLVTGTAANTAYALSIYAKRKDFDWTTLIFNDALGQKRANFDLAAGVIGAIDSGLTAAIPALPGGWRRPSIVGLTSVGAMQVLLRFRLQRIPGNSATVATTYTGDGASGLYVWGAQIELGAFPSSPIPTSGSVATRGLPAITATVPNGFTKALLSYTDATTTLVTGLTPGTSFDIATAVLGASKGRFGVSELVTLVWQP